MTSYTTLDSNGLLPGEPVTSNKALAWYFNLAAGLEGANAAPVNAAAWHPYDAVTVGDGNDGLIYDYSVDGAQATVDSPDFEDGYEYGFVFEDISAASVTVSLYPETTATYTTGTFALATVTPITALYGEFHLVMPRLGSQLFTANSPTGLHEIGPTPTTYRVPNWAATVDAGLTNAPQPLLRARLNFNSTTSGKVFFIRRREYITG